MILVRIITVARARGSLELLLAATATTDKIRGCIELDLNYMSKEKPLTFLINIYLSMFLQGF